MFIEVKKLQNLKVFLSIQLPSWPALHGQAWNSALGPFSIASKGVSQVKNPSGSAGDARITGSILGPEDPLEEAMATHSKYCCLENPVDRESGGLNSP